MADFTQSKSTTLSHQLVTRPDSITGASVAVAGAISCLIVMWHALVSTTANSAPGAFRIFGSLDTSGDDLWFHILDIEVTNGTAVSAAISGTEAIGSTVLEVPATGAIAARNNLYIQDTGTLADSEWHTCKRIVANTSVDLMVGLARAKDSADVIYNQAQQFRVALDCSGLKRVRCDYAYQGASGGNVHVKAEVLVATAIE